MIALNSESGTIAPPRLEQAELNLRHLGANSLRPARGRSPWLSTSRLQQAIVAFWQRSHAAPEFPEAIGATDRELARLGPDPVRRIADSARDANRRLVDLTMMRRW